MYIQYVNDIQFVDKRFITAKKRYYIEGESLYRCNLDKCSRRSSFYQIKKIGIKDSKRFDLLVRSRWVVEDFYSCKCNFYSKFEICFVLERTLEYPIYSQY